MKNAPELKKAWRRAWNLGRQYAEQFGDEDSAFNAMPLEELESFVSTVGFSEFFHAGFIRREPNGSKPSDTEIYRNAVILSITQRTNENRV